MASRCSFQNFVDSDVLVLMPEGPKEPADPASLQSGAAQVVAIHFVVYDSVIPHAQACDTHSLAGSKIAGFLYLDTLVVPEPL